MATKMEIHFILSSRKFTVTTASGMGEAHEVMQRNLRFDTHSHDPIFFHTRHDCADQADLRNARPGSESEDCPGTQWTDPGAGVASRYCRFSCVQLKMGVHALMKKKSSVHARACVSVCG